jgi:hypothetical protein
MYKAELLIDELEKQVAMADVISGSRTNTRKRKATIKNRP